MISLESGAPQAGTEQRSRFLTWRASLTAPPPKVVGNVSVMVRQKATTAHGSRLVQTRVLEGVASSTMLAEQGAQAMRT